MISSHSAGAVGRYIKMYVFFFFLSSKNKYNIILSNDKRKPAETECRHNTITAFRRINLKKKIINGNRT